MLDDYENDEDAMVLEEQSNLLVYKALIMMPDNKLNEKNKNHWNKKQWGLLSTTVLSWAKRSFKNKSVSQVSIMEPLDIFWMWEITFEEGDVSCIKKSFILRKCTSWKPKVLLTAPTDVAAINIDGDTIHILTCHTLNIQLVKLGKNSHLWVTKWNPV